MGWDLILLLATSFIWADVRAPAPAVPSPRQVVLSWFNAFINGDVDTVRSLTFVGGAEDEPLVSALTDVARSIGRLRHTVDKHFGKGKGASFMLAGIDPAAAEEELRKAKETIVGDRATLNTSDMAVELVRKDGIWKIWPAGIVAHNTAHETPAKVTPRIVRVARQIGSVAESVDEGKLKSVSDVSAELNRRLAPTAEDQAEGLVPPERSEETKGE